MLCHNSGSAMVRDLSIIHSNETCTIQWHSRAAPRETKKPREKEVFRLRPRAIVITLIETSKARESFPKQIL